MKKNNFDDPIAAIIGMGIAGAMLNDPVMKKAMFGGKAQVKPDADADVQTKDVDQPEKKVDRMAQNAAALKEIHDSFIQAGFTTDQAFELVKIIFITAMKKVR